MRIAVTQPSVSSAVRCHKNLVARLKTSQTSIDWRMDKPKVINAYNGILPCSKKKKNEVLTPAIIQMNLKNILPSERRQAQKTTCHMIPFKLNIHKRQIYRDRK